MLYSQLIKLRIENELLCTHWDMTKLCEKGFPDGLVVKNLFAVSAGDVGSILGWGRPLEKEMATHSNILVWEIPWIKEPGELQSMGSQESETT